MFQQSSDWLDKSIGPGSSLGIRDMEQRGHCQRYRSKIASRFFLALIIFLPLGLFFPSASSGASLTYQTEAASQGTYDVTVGAGGFIQKNVYNLAFQSSPSDIIGEIDVKQGQTVSQGQVLARLKDGPLRDSLALAYASVRAARLNISAAINYALVAHDSVDAKIHAALVFVHADRNDQDAVDLQSGALVHVADDIIQDDLKNLDAQRIDARALIRHSEALRRQTLDNTCLPMKTAALATATATPTTITTPTPTPLTTLNTLTTPTPTPMIQNTQNTQSTPITQNTQNTITTPTPMALENQNTQNTTTPTPTGTAAPDQASGTTANDPFRAYFECVKQANTQYRLDVAAATANVVNATEQANKDRQSLDQVVATARMNNINAQGQTDIANSLIDVARTDDDYASALTQVASGRGQLLTALTQVVVAQHNLANTILYAPHAGVITGINGTVDGSPGIPPNNALGSGSIPSGVFIQLVDLSSKDQIVVNVAETDILKIQVAQSVSFTLKAFGYRQFSAHIDAISPNGISASGGVVYPVILDVDPASLQGLKPYPNMSATISIVALHDNNVLSIPASAIDFSHQMSTSLNPVLSHQQMQDAQHQADNMLSQMMERDPALALQTLPPLATFVIEQASKSSGQYFVARPVVLLGITNGASYEVLRGLMTGEHVITGMTTKKTP